MSKYVGIARTHWTTHRPSQAAQMTAADFEEIGAQIEDQVQTLAASLAGPDRPGEDYLEKVARLQTARMTAESDVLRQVLPEQEQPAEDLGEQARLASNDQVELTALLEGRAWAIVEQEHHDTPQAEQAAFKATLAAVTRDHELEQATRPS